MFTKERRHFLQCDCGYYDWCFESDLSSGKKRSCGICTWDYTHEERKDIGIATALRKQNKAKGIPRRQQSIFD